jgi:hypothetical protein
MNHFGVDRAVISNLNGIYYKNTQAANEELHAEINSQRTFRDRFIPFAVINPIYSGWKADLHMSATELGMKGVRLYPQYHGYTLADPSCIELVKKARDLGLPVALSMRMVDSRPSSWMDLEIEKEWKLKDVVPILKEVPDAKYILLNIANSMALSDSEMELFRKSELVMDTSGRSLTNLGQHLRDFGTGKFAFGTHTPILDPVTALLRIEALRESEANEDTKELLRSGNIQRILKLRWFVCP